MLEGQGGADIRIDGGAGNPGDGAIAAAKAAEEAAGGEGTQTRTADAPADGGDTKTEGGEGTGTGTENGSENGGEGEDSINPATGKPFTAEEWRDKFRASASGAQALLKDKQTAESERDAERAKVAKLEKDYEELKAIAEGKNPEGVQAHEAQTKLKEMSETLALLTEKGHLDDFERTNPLATGDLRESLKNLARANPSKSLQELWDSTLKAGAEAAAAKRKADDDARKKAAGDQGKGTSTREPASGGNTVSGTKGDTGLSLEEFNALPVVKRKALMEKYGIS